MYMAQGGGSKGNFGEFWGTFFWGTPENPGDFPKIPQKSPKFSKTKFQILLKIIAFVFVRFIFIYLLPIKFWYYRGTDYCSLSTRSSELSPKSSDWLLYV